MGGSRARGSRMKQIGQVGQEGMDLQHSKANIAAEAGVGATEVMPSAEQADLPAIDYEKLATMVAGKLAPVFRTSETNTEQFDVGQAPDIILKDGTLATGGLDLAAIDKPLNSDYVQDLAFMEEEIEVMVNETEDANAENPVIVGNNGIFKAFFRGRSTIAKRKFVDCLIVKSTRVTTPEVLNGGGERTNLIKQHSAHKYPFSVVRDRNPKGVEWLRRRLAEVI